MDRPEYSRWSGAHLVVGQDGRGTLIGDEECEDLVEDPVIDSLPAGGNGRPVNGGSQKAPEPAG